MTFITLTGSWQLMRRAMTACCLTGQTVIELLALVSILSDAVLGLNIDA